MMTGSEPSVVLVRRMGASATDVYNAWVDPVLIARWMKPGPEWAVMAEIAARVGSLCSIVSIDGDGKSHTISGVYRELSPGRRIFLTWIYSGPLTQLAAKETLLAIEFRSVEPDVTQVTLTHTRLVSEFERDYYRENWTAALDRMQDMFEDILR